MTESIVGALTVNTDVKMEVNVVWLKRDLRLSDHQALTDSIKSGLTLLFYVFEPLLIDDPHYDERHWRFVWQSIQDINNQLASYNTRATAATTAALTNRFWNRCNICCINHCD